MQTTIFTCDKCGEEIPDAEWRGIKITMPVPAGKDGYYDFCAKCTQWLENAIRFNREEGQPVR